MGVLVERIYDDGAVRAVYDDARRSAYIEIRSPVMEDVDPETFARAAAFMERIGLVPLDEDEPGDGAVELVPSEEEDMLCLRVLYAPWEDVVADLGVGE